LENIFQDELLKDEKILWMGQPNPNIKYTSMDWFLVPFSIFWGGFAIFWELSVLGISFLSNENGDGAPFFFALFGIPFVVMGIYFIFGRFIYKKWKKKRTYYAITNKRVLIVTNTNNRNIEAEFIASIPAINYSQKSNGAGTIRFGNFNFMTDMYANTGMDFFSGFSGKSSPAFFDIDNVKEAYTLVNEVRNSDNKS
jgi:hypothetical protein